MEKLINPIYLPLHFLGVSLSVCRADEALANLKGRIFDGFQLGFIILECSTACTASIWEIGHFQWTFNFQQHNNSRHLAWTVWLSG